MSSSEDLLRIEDLRINFRVHSSIIEAVKGASFRIRPGKVTALVGESGSGKSVIGQSIMGILPTVGSIAGGAITFNDPKAGSEPVQIEQLLPSGPEMREMRGGRIAMIFQEPMTSLSPLHTIGNQIEEALQLHQPVDRNAARAKTEEMLDLVGFPNPARAYDMYSFELSGGLRQRAMIAMALICRPALLIADEPTTALDVTIQAQILQLLKDLQESFNMAILLITHDLGVVANMADEVVVIYHGQVVEAGQVSHIFRSPQHPYLKALLNAVPHFDMKRGERLVSLRDVKVDAAKLLKGPESRRKKPKTGCASARSRCLVTSCCASNCTSRRVFFSLSSRTRRCISTYVSNTATPANSSANSAKNRMGCSAIVAMGFPTLSQPGILSAQCVAGQGAVTRR